MLYEFGKILRKIRIDNQELLKDMAKKLGVSSAYLSAVETGKRKVPNGWVAKVANLYALDGESKDELELACERSAQEVKISLAKATGLQREAALSFAKALEGLDDQKLRKIMEVVDERKR